MDLIQSKIQKMINSGQRALENLNEGNKRLSLGDLDYVHDYLIAAKCLLIEEIKEDEESEKNQEND
ncbi:hypothetical protein [Heyndrickxia camelliae]|uniref:Uncharacterized protein n=1 Tax=Heyndrickxia camelliae TaxID=1707093 RepID=A0A2N3LG31_9BACI|nr:hypothetical protein [Heyndrickxia camelliae]PKR83504.1 hypothetical protein CWO92_18215 [Heyndrickxia camelliae]